MDESSQSLQAVFESAKAQKKSLESDSAASNGQYQEQLSAAISTFARCQSMVSQLSVFSRNESVEDIATADLQYGVLVERLVGRVGLR